MAELWGHVSISAYHYSVTAKNNNLINYSATPPHTRNTLNIRSLTHGERHRLQCVSVCLKLNEACAWYKYMHGHMFCMQTHRFLELCNTHTHSEWTQLSWSTSHWCKIRTRCLKEQMGTMTHTLDSKSTAKLAWWRGLAGIWFINVAANNANVC